VNPPQVWPFTIDAFGIGVLLKVAWFTARLWMPFFVIVLLIGLWLPRRRDR
jgi:hypothetical protein